MREYEPNYTSKFYDAYGSMNGTGSRPQLMVAYRRSSTPTSYTAMFVTVTESWTLDVVQGGSQLKQPSWERMWQRLICRKGNLNLPRRRSDKQSCWKRVDAFTPGDITDLSLFSDGQFDAVVYYGGPLSYVCGQRCKAASELVRVVPPGGILLISVMNRFGSMANWLAAR